MTFDERKQYAEEKKTKKKESRDPSPSQATAAPGEAGSKNTHAQMLPETQHSETQSAAYENAIRESVKATSRGDPDEDMLIERAIRASVAELQLATNEGDEDDAVQRAVRASVAEAGGVPNERGETLAAGAMGFPEDRDGQSKQAPKGRAQGQDYRDEQRSGRGSSEWADSGVDTDDGEELKMVLEKSKRTPTTRYAGEEDVQKAIELSRKAHQEAEEAESRAKTEEEMVLEYVKKQSLAEEQYRQSRAAKGKTGGGDGNAGSGNKNDDGDEPRPVV